MPTTRSPSQSPGQDAGAVGVGGGVGGAVGLGDSVGVDGGMMVGLGDCVGVGGGVMVGGAGVRLAVRVGGALAVGVTAGLTAGVADGAAGSTVSEPERLHAEQQVAVDVGGEHAVEVRSIDPGASGRSGAVQVRSGPSPSSCGGTVRSDTTSRRRRGAGAIADRAALSA